MTLVFLNAPSGSASPYNGWTFSDTGSTLLGQIQTTLTSAGWATVVTPTSSNLFMYGTSIVGGFNCYINFAITNSGSQYTLTLRGYLTGATFSGLPSGTGSPNNTHYLTWTAGNTNSLWLTADQEAFCICIYNSNIINSNYCQGIHAGFLQRVDLTDQYAWMIGYIHQFGYSFAYSASTKYNGTNWHQLSSDFYQYNNYAYLIYSQSNQWNTNSISAPLTTFDALSRYCSAWSDNNATSQNAAYSMGIGRLNYDGSAVIDPYYYIEGRGSTSNYNVIYYLPNQFQMYMRGAVKYAYCGVSCLSAGNQIVDSISGYRILSTGYYYWQGMRIL